MLLNELVKEALTIYSTQGELAKQIGISDGVLSKALNSWKHGFPSERVQKLITKYFNCKVEYLTPLDIIKQKDAYIAKINLAYEKLFNIACEANLQVCECRELLTNIKSSIDVQLDMLETYNMEAFKLENIKESK